jgi:uridine kinase
MHDRTHRLTASRQSTGYVAWVTSFESVSTWRQRLRPLTGEDHRDKAVMASPDAVLIVDSVFAFRPQYNSFWDYRIWLDVDAQLSMSRGISPDLDAEGIHEAARLHQERYHAAEAIYVAEVDPCTMANVIIDNSDFANPKILSVGEG